MTSSHKLGGMPTVHLSPELLAELVRIGFERYPREACGVLLPVPRGQRVESQVIEIPNRAIKTNTEYTMWGSDIRLAIYEWGITATHEQREAVAVWHTHPSGNVGPSPGDMAKRIEGASYLVVALDRDTRQGTPTWF